MEININEIHIKIKVLDDKKTKAIIGLDFGDCVVRGFRIIESQYPNANGDLLWFMPPSYQSGGRHHPIFFMPNKELWRELEKRVYEEYKLQYNKHFKKRLGISDEEYESI